MISLEAEYLVTLIVKLFAMTAETMYLPTCPAVRLMVLAVAPVTKVQSVEEIASAAKVGLVQANHLYENCTPVAGVHVPVSLCNCAPSLVRPVRAGAVRLRGGIRIALVVFEKDVTSPAMLLAVTSTLTYLPAMSTVGL